MKRIILSLGTLALVFQSAIGSSTEPEQCHEKLAKLNKALTEMMAEEARLRRAVEAQEGVPPFSALNLRQWIGAFRRRAPADQDWLGVRVRETELPALWQKKLFQSSNDEWFMGKEGGLSAYGTVMGRPLPKDITLGDIPVSLLFSRETALTLRATGCIDLTQVAQQGTSARAEASVEIALQSELKELGIRYDRRRRDPKVKP